MTRKPILTLRPAEEALPEVRLAGWPCYFAVLQKGYAQDWLQYSFKTGDLSMFHRTTYAAQIDWDGKACHEVRVEYYEPEFPDARLLLALLIEASDDALAIVRWTQYYPGFTAESLAVHGDRLPKVLRPGLAWRQPWRYGNREGETEYRVGSTFILDSCRQKQVRCLQLAHTSGDSYIEEYIGEDGRCVLHRTYRRVADDQGTHSTAAEDGSGTVPDVAVNNVTYRAVADCLPNSLVFATHW